MRARAIAATPGERPSAAGGKLPGLAAPPSPSTTRHAAILAMDVAGYSRLMELDERGTFVRIRAIMDEVVTPRVAQGGGRVFKTTGDGAFAELPAAEAAVTCALALQAENEARQRAEPPDRRIRFRIGLHVSEVIATPDDIFGEGINIAARLEGLAGVGEVYVSEAIAGQAPGSCRFVDLGHRRLKNIARPVRVFRAADPADEQIGSGMAAGSLGPYLPGFGDYPAIAVLPFREAGAAETHFADGMTEDVIAALSRWRTFPVISRNSVYALAAGAGGSLDVRLVGQQLGVRYLMEGSIRRAGDRVRVAISLLDVETDTVLLRETQDCALGDIFAMQDHLVTTVVGRLEPALLQQERTRVATARPANPTLYELVQLAAAHHYRYEAGSNATARELLAQALAMDAQNTRALVAFSLALTHAANVGWLPDKGTALREASGVAERAVALSPTDPAARFALGTALQNMARPDEAAEQLSQAVQLQPSHAAAYANLGFVQCFLDRPDEALPNFEMAFRLSPADPRRFIWSPGVAASHFLAGRLRAALAAAQTALSLNPRHPVALRYAAATFGAMGLSSEAAPLVAMLRRVDGTLANTAAHLRRSYRESAVLRLLDGLERAGFG